MNLLNSYCGSIISSYFSVQFSHSVVSDSLWPHELQHARPPCPSPSPGVCPSSCSLHLWCHPAMSSSDALVSFCPWSFPASRTFPMSRVSEWVSEVAQSCPTLCNPMDCSPPGSSIHGILQARMLEWVRWPKYWSFIFSISPSSECSGLISLKIDWFDLLDVQGTRQIYVESKK